MKFTDSIVAGFNAGQTWSGSVKPGRAAMLYRNGIRALRPDLSVAHFTELARGGEFILLPKESLPRELLDRLAENGNYGYALKDVLLPPGYGQVLQQHRLVAIATLEELAAGGRFSVVHEMDGAVFEGTEFFEDHEILDRTHRWARNIGRAIFDRWPILRAFHHKDITVVLPFVEDHIAVLHN